MRLAPPHVWVGLERGARHPLAMDVRAALPLDEELLCEEVHVRKGCGGVGSGLNAKGAAVPVEVVRLRAAGAAHAAERLDTLDREPFCPAAWRHRWSGWAACSPAPVVGSIDPQAFGVELAVEDDEESRHCAGRRAVGSFGKGDDAELRDEVEIRGGGGLLVPLRLLGLLLELLLLLLPPPLLLLLLLEPLLLRQLLRLLLRLLLELLLLLLLLELLLLPLVVQLLLLLVLELLELLLAGSWHRRRRTRRRPLGQRPAKGHGHGHGDTATAAEGGGGGSSGTH